MEFPKITLRLDGKYGRGQQFVIEARNASKENKYIQSAELNGKQIESFLIPQSEILKGGTLILNMGSEPNRAWGVSTD